MARIKDEDIQLVRERVRIDEVVEQYVTLRNAGGGARKGLCPFHDEKSPSFNVRPAQGFYHCFGCGVGGDAIKFLMEIEGLTFAESVERLADKYGVQLRYEETGAPTGPRRDPGQRQRLLLAHKAAERFYAEQLMSSPEAAPGRRLVTDRGFDQAAAELFGMGWAPKSGQALVNHLRGKGFAEDELVIGGLARKSARGLFDAFQGRLMWPIKEISGEVIGFGARRMFDDDFMSGKYVNTSETPIYKKAQVLYGIDLARDPIRKQSQAVVVEGYTDVMACHQAGVLTAVATCGTAFGEGHARVLRRLMLDHDAFHGEVIFTFDGDEAGQKAAVKAFEGDEEFTGQTYVAVEGTGKDPCDLRLAEGDEAVRELIGSRIPLYRFVLDNTLERYDLDRGDQRIDAVREAVRLASAVRDTSKVDEFLREIATRAGVDIDLVHAEHRKAKDQKPSAPKLTRAGAGAPEPEPARPEASVFASFGAPQFAAEREALKALAQYPQVARTVAADLTDDDFVHPVAREIWRHMVARGLPDHADAGWLPAVADSLPGDDLRRVLGVAAVEPLHASEQTAVTVVPAVLAHVQELAISRQIGDVKSRLQRTDPTAPEYQEVFGQLVALEQRRRGIRDRALGAVGS
ncbi:DNA primase [Aeromicrobium duanguangcaii]|uniref:DNA primase n=1 Tax=Aeromicrobium duanguangcaii TaxID=2968086 RepID=A0ABY5KGA8_9ACTN|nr:DNA primase [Aeromicrobium duanguangcaii]MCD9153397.1 DNA primase [Aeromicrobium duanguangcaii]UUI69511.1 DNA primase [Aeromicrobium duanguangcaii]